jgi:hypothetical protein
MALMIRYLYAALLAGSVTLPAMAEEFTIVPDRRAFLGVVSGKTLTRFGIQLDVRQDGKITGDAFGQSVTGAWTWANGLFCRDLSWGNRDLGPNCQIVKVDRDTIRFISDRGNGRSADMRLR